MAGPQSQQEIPSVRLDRRLATPLFRQVYQRIREAILDGTLPPGASLPSTRSLAGQLSTARGTIELAYALLAGEGYVVGRAAAGTVVNPGLSQLSMLARGQTLAGKLTGPRLDFARAQPAHAFQMGLPALDAFPRYARLRQAIARYLAIARGISCSTGQILITAGYQGALGLIARTLLVPGDAVWFENPGYFRARDALATAGATIVPVPVDRDGLDIHLAIERSPKARLVVVTPSHECPLGVTLSLPRRLELLAWAAKTRAWIIEDDYDSEFRYLGRPLPALKGLDDAGRVFYAGSFSKVLNPGLRLGYLVVPLSEVDRFYRAAELFAPSSSLLDQMVVADFMIEGHFARHLRRMRRLYAARRDALVSALRTVFDDRLALDVPAGGMHVIGRFSGRRNDAALAERAQREGLALLSSCLVGRPSELGLLLSFTNIPVEEATREAQRLHRLLFR